MKILYAIVRTPMKRLRVMSLITIVLFIWAVMGVSARSRKDRSLVKTLVSDYRVSPEGAEEAVYNILHKKKQ